MSAETDFIKLVDLIAESKTIHQSYQYQHASKHSQQIYNRAITMGGNVLADRNDPRMQPQLMAKLTIQTIVNAKWALGIKSNQEFMVTEQVNRLKRLVRSQKFTELPIDDQRKWFQLAHRVNLMNAHADKHGKELIKLAQQIARQFADRSKKPEIKAKLIKLKANHRVVQATITATPVVSKKPKHLIQSIQPRRGSQHSSQSIIQSAVAQLSEPQSGSQLFQSQPVKSTTTQATTSQSVDSQIKNNSNQAVVRSQTATTQPGKVSQEQSTSESQSIQQRSISADLTTTSIDSMSSRTPMSAEKRSVTQTETTSALDSTSQSTNSTIQKLDEKQQSSTKERSSVWYSIWHGLARAIGFDGS